MSKKQPPDLKVLSFPVNDPVRDAQEKCLTVLEYARTLAPVDVIVVLTAGEQILRVNSEMSAAELNYMLTVVQDDGTAE